MRLRDLGLGLGRVGMKNLKNSHKGMCCARILHKGMCYANFAQGTIHPPKCEIVVLSNGKDSWFLRVGNAS